MKQIKRSVYHWDLYDDYGDAQKIYSPQIDRFYKAYFGHTVSDELVEEIQRTLHKLTEKIYNYRQVDAAALRWAAAKI